MVKLTDLTHIYAIRNENDQYIRSLNHIQSRDDLYKLLKVLFEDHIRDTDTLKKSDMLELSAYSITDFFDISIREHWIDGSGEAYLKRRHGSKDCAWCIDTFMCNQKLYVSSIPLGRWQEIKVYTDYLSALAMVWLPSAIDKHSSTIAKTL